MWKYFSASAYITVTVIPLARARPVVNPRLIVGGDCPVSWIQGGVRSATIYPNHPFPRALQCQPCHKGTSFFVLSSIVLSAPVQMTCCLHSPNFVTSDLNPSDFLILLQDCRGPLTPGYGLIFLVLESQVEIMRKTRRVTKTVIRREQLCLSVKHSLVVKNGNLKRHFICKCSQHKATLCP